MRKWHPALGCYGGYKIDYAAEFPLYTVPTLLEWIIQDLSGPQAREKAEAVSDLLELDFWTPAAKATDGWRAESVMGTVGLR